MEEGASEMTEVEKFAAIFSVVGGRVKKKENAIFRRKEVEVASSSMPRGGSHFRKDEGGGGVH